jgi:tRNA threonylcarbamoyladenosine biosynthesis protein TsaB
LKILHFDTSSPICSVTLSDGDNILETIEETISNSHASKLTTYIKEICRNNKIDVPAVKALSFSAGPGSYTGLRIGLSTIKGISYALNIPIVFVNTLDAISFAMIEEFNQNDFIYCPMIDARRNEVYTASFNNKNELQGDYTSLILNNGLDFNVLKNKKNIVVGGDGVKKYQNGMFNSEVTYSNIQTTSSKYLVSLATKKILSKVFENNSYCEPLYLKKPFLNHKKKPDDTNQTN